jgi:hypothetical protein
MLRYYEIALIAAPLIGALLWWRLSQVRLVVAIATIITVAVLAVLVISYENGRIVEGHGSGVPPAKETKPAPGTADP